MTALQAEDGSHTLDEVRQTLLGTAGRMESYATKWAASGVDAAELQAVVDEAQVFGEKVRRAGEGVA
ncbi:hypothetical protein AB0M34_35755 [Nocardia sp. NPDC050193]